MIIGLNGSLLFSNSYYKTKGILAYVLLSITRFHRIITQERNDSENQDEFRSIMEIIFISNIETNDPTKNSTNLEPKVVIPIVPYI